MQQGEGDYRHSHGSGEVLPWLRGDVRSWLPPVRQSAQNTVEPPVAPNRSLTVAINRRPADTPLCVGIAFRSTNGMSHTVRNKTFFRSGRAPPEINKCPRKKQGGGGEGIDLASSKGRRRPRSEFFVQGWGNFDLKQ